jgi:hypothetical protein
MRHSSSPPSMAGSLAISEVSLPASLPAALWQRLGATQGNKAEQLKSLVLITTCRVLSPNGDCGLFCPKLASAESIKNDALRAPNYKG